MDMCGVHVHKMENATIVQLVRTKISEVAVHAKFVPQGRSNRVPDRLPVQRVGPGDMQEIDINAPAAVLVSMLAVGIAIVAV